MSQDKQALRLIIRDRLNSLSEENKALQSESILQKIMRLQFPDGGICIYNSLPSEVDTKGIIKHFIGKRKVYLPTVDGDELMLVEVDGNTQYRLANWGILEPIGQKLYPQEINPTVTLTPLLGADKSLNRLGKGKGFYDRYFAKVNTLRVGLAFDEQVVESVPTDSYDKPLDMLITPSVTIGDK